MADMMMFPNTVEEFMEQYKIVDDEKVYTNGADLIPIFRMMQWFEHVSATDKNFGTKISKKQLELARAIDGLTEWQKHVQTDSNINRDITVAIEALKAQLGTNLAEVGTDTISRQAAIDVLKQMRKDGNLIPWEGKKVFEAIRNLPYAQPEIIRCRNCKFASGDSRICMKFGHSPIGELDFCAWAERRTDG